MVCGFLMKHQNLRLDRLVATSVDPVPLRIDISEGAEDDGREERKEGVMRPTQPFDNFLEMRRESAQDYFQNV